MESASPGSVELNGEISHLRSGESTSPHAEQVILINENEGDDKPASFALDSRHVVVRPGAPVSMTGYRRAAALVRRRHSHAHAACDRRPASSCSGSALFVACPYRAERWLSGKTRTDFPIGAFGAPPNRKQSASCRILKSQSPRQGRKRTTPLASASLHPPAQSAAELASLQRRAAVEAAAEP